MRVTGLVVFLLLISLTALAEEPAVLYACVNVGNGGMRLVDETVACRPNETRVEWNAAGPAGPAGPPGPPGADGEDGEDAGGPPYIWACTPVNYGNAGSSNASLHIFNGSASTANVAVHFLNKDGVNLVGVTVPGSVPPNPGDPLPTFPGQTGAATVAVLSSHTLVMPFVTAFGVPATGGDIPATIRVVSDQPIAVGAHIFFSGLSVIPCSFVPK